ncbi:MAG: hypothetical protein U5O16_35345 [Rhodococcus sp. (in: high G+C Gram-positive bacteria)]|nr:hypothetical protein [Rhodococcus sp. (in: high G+C Gram-positive bacteria)]
MGSFLLQQISLALGIIMSPLAVVAVVACSFPNERGSTASRTWSGGISE